MGEQLQNATQETKDNLGDQGLDAQIILRKQEQYLICEGSSEYLTTTIGDSWIAGSATNGLVGTNTATQGGGQQVVGGSGRVETLSAVTNVDNIFKEFLVLTRYVDSSETSAVVSTSNQDITF